jgi:hypothetical protein
MGGARGIHSPLRHCIQSTKDNAEGVEATIADYGDYRIYRKDP